MSVKGRKAKARATAGQPHPLLLWREAHGMLQKDLAVAIGVSIGTLSQIENWNRIPLGDKLERLLTLTGLSTDALVRPQYYVRVHPDAC